MLMLVCQSIVMQKQLSHRALAELNLKTINKYSWVLYVFVLRIECKTN